MKGTSTEEIYVTAAISPVAITTSDPTSIAINCAGYDECQFALTVGVTGAITTAPTAVVKECATSGGTYATFSSGTYTYTESDDDKTFVWRINCRKRLQFLKLVVTTGSVVSTPISAVAVLSRKNVLPVTPEQTIIGNV